MDQKIMILTASTGGGHNSAAKAIANELTQNKATPLIVDAFKDLGYVGKFLNIIISQGYEASAKYTPKIYGKAYNVTDLSLMRKTFDINLIIGYMEKNILKLIEQKNIKKVITTHPFASVAISNIKKNYIHELSITCIITDYTPHKSYLSKYIDNYVVAHEDTALLVEKQGISKNKIHPFGIPTVMDKIGEDNKKNIKKTYGIDDHFTILVMGGSFGAGKIKKTYNKLQKINEEINIIVLCGKNELVKESLEEKIALHPPGNTTKIVGFTNRMQDYYQMADLAITKPGGLTVTECLYYEVPMIIPYFIPGQEEGNKDFIINNQLGVVPSKYYPLEIVVKSMIHDKEKLEIIKTSLRKNKKLDSAKKIAELVL